MSRLSKAQSMILISGAVLLGRHGHVLSEHEQATVASAGLRFRDKGDAAFITGNEWGVIEPAVRAMQAARAEAERTAKRGIEETVR